MEVRFAERCDIDALVRFRFDYFREEPELTLSGDMEPVIEERLRHYFNEHLNKDFFASLVEHEAQLAAVSFLAIHEKPANINCQTGKTSEILNVYTLPEHRRKGFSTASLKLLIDKARELNASNIKLSASPSGKYVYEKLGFVVVPARSFTDMRLILETSATL